jgi:hypothetical protein
MKGRMTNGGRVFTVGIRFTGRPVSGFIRKASGTRFTGSVALTRRGRTHIIGMNGLSFQVGMLR